MRQAGPHSAAGGDDELLVGDGVARLGRQLLLLDVHARNVRVGLVHDAWFGTTPTHEATISVLWAVSAMCTSLQLNVRTLLEATCSVAADSLQTCPL